MGYLFLVKFSGRDPYSLGYSFPLGIACNSIRTIIIWNSFQQDIRPLCFYVNQSRNGRAHSSLFNKEIDFKDATAGTSSKGMLSKSGTTTLVVLYSLTKILTPCINYRLSRDYLKISERVGSTN